MDGEVGSHAIEGLVVCHPNRQDIEIDGLAQLIAEYKGPVMIIQHLDDSKYEVQRPARVINSQDGISFEGDGKRELENFLKQLDIARVVGCYLSGLDNTKLCVDYILELCQQIVPRAYADKGYCVVMRASNLVRKK